MIRSPFDDLVPAPGEAIEKPDPPPDQAPDPVEATRRAMRQTLPKRFWTDVSVAPAEEGGFAVSLDGRSLRTPAKARLVVPHVALAELVAAEWRAVEGVIDPARMPVTRLANSAIDGVGAPGAAEAVADDVARYAGSDLVCYRAGEPARLVAWQAAAWDPVLDWAREALGARFVLSEGVRFVEQPEWALAAVRRAVRTTPAPFGLAALHVATTLTGSVLIALRLAHGATSAEEAFAAAHVDEAFQREVWGADAEADARLASRREEFDAAARVLEAVRGGG